MTVDAERAHWDAVSGDPPESMIRHGDWAESIEADLAMVDVGDEGPILDLGCGIGRLTVAYARRRQCSVIGVDVSLKMLSRACEREYHEPLDEVAAVYAWGDGRTLPPLPSLGGAFSVLMFQHIPASAQASYVGQVAHLLLPGARFIFQTVIGTEDTFLSHQVGWLDPACWCADAGLQVLGVEGGESGWQWITARR